jgi:hypothetical protein
VTWAADNCIGGDESNNFGASLLWDAESLTDFDHLVLEQPFDFVPRCLAFGGGSSAPEPFVPHTRALLIPFTSLGLRSAARSL